MTHEQDQRDHFSTAIAQTSTLITTLEAERAALVKAGATELPEEPKDVHEVTSAAVDRCKHFVRLAEIDRDLAIQRFEFKSLERQLAEVAA
jgi:hypothetical protein